MDIFFDRIAPLIVDARSKGVKDADMERTMGLPAHSINKWFTGKYKSYKNYLPQIAAFFGVTVSYLIGEDEKKPAPTNEDGLTEAQRDFIRLVPTLTDRELGVLLLTAKALIAARQ